MPRTFSSAVENVKRKLIGRSPEAGEAGEGHQLGGRRRQQRGVERRAAAGRAAALRGRARGHRGEARRRECGRDRAILSCSLLKRVS